MTQLSVVIDILLKSVSHYCLMPPCHKNTGSRPSKQPHSSLTICLPLSLKTNLLIKFLWATSLIIPFFGFLDLFVGPIYGPSIGINLIFGPILVSSWAIALITRVIFASISSRAAPTSLGMLSSLRPNFLLLRNPLLHFFPAHNSTSSQPITPSSPNSSPRSSSTSNMPHSPRSSLPSPYSLSLPHSSIDEPITHPSHPMTAWSKSNITYPHIRSNGKILWLLPKPTLSLTTSSTSPMYFTISVPEEPTSYFEAPKYHEQSYAMNHEFQALLQNQTWEIVPLSSNYSILSSKQMLKTKRRADGSLEYRKVHSWPRDFISYLLQITLKPSARQSNQSPFTFSSPLQSPPSGLFINQMYQMPSSMRTLKDQCLCSNHRDSSVLITHRTSVSFENPFTVQNMPLGPGLQNLVIELFRSVFMALGQTPLYLCLHIPQIACIYWFAPRACFARHQLESLLERYAPREFGLTSA